jgi:sec-independent protein translocase protein TatA
MNIGTTELMVILALALFLYGKKLPEITRSLGKGYREFKNAFDGVKNDIQKQVTDIAKDTGIKEAGLNDNPDEVRQADKIYPAETKESNEKKPPFIGDDTLAG